ncbi:MAG: hypothetical protein WC196_06170 [Bacilli bacterium]
MSQRQIAKCRMTRTPDPNSEVCGKCEYKFICFTTGRMRKVQTGKFRYVFDVPNNEEGQKFLELCKKFLNKGLWDIKPRGRNSNRKDLPYRNHCRDVKSKDAEWFAVYLNKKGRSDYESS